jgi:hypothetical protein
MIYTIQNPTQPWVLFTAKPMKEKQRIKKEKKKLYNKWVGKMPTHLLLIKVKNLCFNKKSRGKRQQID